MLSGSPRLLTHQRLLRTRLSTRVAIFAGSLHAGGRIDHSGRDAWKTEPVRAFRFLDRLLRASLGHVAVEKIAVSKPSPKSEPGRLTSFSERTYLAGRHFANDGSQPYPQAWPFFVQK